MTHFAADKQSNMVGVALVAALAGAVTALLLAPKRGTEMREDLKGHMQKMKQTSQNKVDQTRTKIADTADQIRDKVRDTTDKTADSAKSVADSARDKTKQAADEAAERAHSRTNR